MMQRRGYFVSRYDSTVFRTWGQRQFKQALRAGHKPIVHKMYLDLLAWRNQKDMLAVAA